MIRRGRKDRVPLKSDFTQFVGEIGAVQAESNSEEFPCQLCPLPRKMIRKIQNSCFCFEWQSITSSSCWLLLVLRQTSKQTNRVTRFLLVPSSSLQAVKEVGGHHAFSKQSQLTQLWSKLTPPTFLKFTKNQLRHAWFMLVLFQKVLFHTDSS